MKKIFLLTLALSMGASTWAETAPEASEVESEGSGFLTSALNNTIESAWASAAQENPSSSEKMQYGRKVTGYVSAPKFGGYAIGKFEYNDRDGAKGGTGFSQRLIRLYVDGTILRDFKYRIQVQTNNDKFHMKDVFIEWQRYDFLRVKVGQFKRAFGFENPMNPWDILTGDYSYFTKKLTGDYRGDAWGGGGRDQGIQLQGDVVKIGEDQHYLIHYQAGIWNGEGINKSNADGRMDYIGTIQFQPVKGLLIGAFGWTGEGNGEKRDKYAFGVKYDDPTGWSLRGEWGHSHYTSGNDDAWYIVGGVPVNDWFKLCAQYQTYRPGKSWDAAQCTYSLIPEFQLHKNLKFQLQYNWNDFRGSYDKHFNQLWAEVYFRF